MPIFEAAIEGLISAVSPEVLPYLLLGAVFGLIVGIIPGLSGHFAMAMLIPFVFRMGPATGIAFVLGAHATVSQGGGVTAILFGVPGTGQNAATLLDGPAMTQKGEGGRAVGAAMMACFLGLMFGVLVLTLLLPVLRHVVLLFGPPEFFMLALMALTFIAALSAKGTGINKGLIAGFLGILLSFVGMCNVTGVKRFTFGLMELWGGLSFVPVMLGVFAVAEMFDLWIEGGSLSSKGTDLHSSALQKQIFQGIRDTFRRWWLVIRCSAIGTTIGIIPGLGAATAAFLAYAHAKQSSKHPENFGKGEIEGVIGPESANDAVEGGALASTVAFGIPGSSSMAILIAVLIILGVQPGPELMITRLDLVFVMIWTIVIGNLIGTLVGMFLANPLTRITFLRSSVVVPILLIIIFTGAYVVNGLWVEMLITFFFGALGYIMKKLDYSRPAFIIGMILGIMVEKNYYLAVRIYGKTFFLQPIALALLLITVIFLIYNVYGVIKSERRSYSRAA